MEFHLTFTSDTVIYPFENIEFISDMTMDGDVELYSDTSLVRVILEDEYGFQYMIFEAYPLICPGNETSPRDYCDETCFLDMINPYSLIIQVIDAKLDLKWLYYDYDPKSNPTEQRFEAKRAKDALKIAIMNDQISWFGMNWTAGDNDLVSTYYDQKKQLFGEKYNVLGYDYYKGGVFEFLGHRNYPKVSPDLVKQFDWRDRHGANDSLSPYYDGDTLNTGWFTSVKDQMSCGSCWAFATLGLTEVIANLYSSEHIDYDLSEQDLICNGGAGNCDGGSVFDGLTYGMTFGYISESCYSYDTINYDDSCGNHCVNPNPVIKINNYEYNLLPSEKNYDSVRVDLINYGPLGFTYRITDSSAHAVVLAGFEFNPKDSTLIWIIKNSKGLTWGDHGFGYLQLEDFRHFIRLIPPIYENNVIISAQCEDKDLDGYCFWGLREKPSNCPCQCDTIEDCDDSNPMVGGYDEYYNCLCLVEYDTTIIHISTDSTWNDSLIVQNPIVIDSGACLTITAVAQIHPDVKITVDKGGKLILDGGVLTNACPDLWEGIDVLGSNIAQYYSQFFGVLEIKDGGTIENARVAVSNYCKACEYQDAGGIINADDGIFRNNQVAFEFAPFSNIYQGTERPYLGSFERCQFIYDEFLQDYGDFRYFIKLNEVNGITIKGCEFNCDTISLDPRTERSLKYKSGIYSSGSYFSVDEACAEDILPCPGYVPCVFKGLNYGIYALGITGTEVISIKKSNFISNRTGIYLSGENYATIVQDTFKVFYEKKSMDTICGVYLDNCSGYHVEENEFYGNFVFESGWGESFSKCIGIAINNSGEEPNEIYNNRFDSLFIGTIAQNVNRDDKEGTGLQILCNDYAKNYFDISVTADNSSGINGIAYDQGSYGSRPTSTANNTFSHFKPDQNNDSSDYANECAILNYWHLMDTTTAFTKPKYYSVLKVLPSINLGYDRDYNKDTCCPSKYSIGSEDIILENRLQLGLFNEKADSIINLISLLEDGGDTYGLRSEILNSSPDDDDDLYGLLLDNSPYLSDSVMVASAEIESVLSCDMLTDILSENPQAAKSDTVQFVLNNRVDELSEEQRVAIDQGWFITGDLEKMKSTYSYYNRRQSNAFYTLAREFKSDTSLVNAFDSLTLLYQEYPSLRSKYDLVFEFVKKGDSRSAIAALNSIPVNYSLDTEELVYYEETEQFLPILASYLLKNCLDILDSTQLSTLTTLSQIGLGQTRALSRNILLATNFSSYKEPYIFPQHSLKSSTIRRIPVKYDEESNDMIVFPNPAGEEIQIDLGTNDFRSQGILEIYDITGKLIFTKDIAKWQKSITLNTNEFSSGVYLIRFGNDAGNFKTKKLIITDK